MTDDTRLGEFSIDDVIGASFRVLFDNFAVFLSLAVLADLPSYLPLLLGDPGSAAMAGVRSFTLLLLDVALGAVLVGAFCHGTEQHLRKRPVIFADCLSQGRRSFLPVLFVLLLTTVSAGAAALLLVVPGLVVMTVLWVALPAAAIERSGVIASFRRSAELTKGCRWRVCALLLMTIGAMAVAYVAIPAVTSPAPSTLVLLLSWGFSAFLGSLMTLLPIVSYHILRQREGGAGRRAARLRAPERGQGG